MREEEIEFEIADKLVPNSSYMSPRDFLIYLGRKWRDGTITDKMLNVYIEEAESGDNELLYRRHKKMLREVIFAELRKLVDDKIYFYMGFGTYQLAEALKRKVPASLFKLKFQY